MRPSPALVEANRSVHQFAGVAADSVPDVFVPQADAARDAGIVGRDMHVGGQRDVDIGGVSAAGIQHVVVQKRVDDVDRLQNALVPLLSAGPPIRGDAVIVVVGIFLPNRVV